MSVDTCLPRVKLDLSNQQGIPEWLCDTFMCEILSINFNTGTSRVRVNVECKWHCLDIKLDTDQLITICKDYARYN